ncbi:MAG: glycosyltransferase family 39 protein [Anaerolineales bacterium]
MLQRYRKGGLIVFLLLAFCFGYFYQDGGYNANSRFDLIFAIVRQERFTIDTYQNRPGTLTGDTSYFNGHYYSDKAVGPAMVGAVLYVPLYWMNRIFHHVGQTNAEEILTFLVIGIPSALAGSLIYILCYYLTKSRFRAYLITLAITLGSMYFPYSVTFFSHQFSSSLLFGAFFLIFILKEKPEIWKNWYAFLIGLLMGWAFISEYPTAIIIIALICYYILVIWRNQTYPHFQSIILPILGGSIPLLIQMVYNKVCFGAFFSIGYEHELSNQYNSAMAKGLMGIHWPDLKVVYYMTFHPMMGLFWQSPALLFSIVGAVFVFSKRRYRAEAILALWIIVAYLVIISGYYMWWGGFALGPRDIIPMLPYFCIFLAFVPKRLTWPLAILSLISIGQMIIAAASTVQDPDLMVSKIATLGFFAYTNIYSYCLKLLDKGNFTQNLGHQFLGLISWDSLIPLFVVIGGVTFFFLYGMDKVRPIYAPASKEAG